MCAVDLSYVYVESSCCSKYFFDAAGVHAQHSTNLCLQLPYFN